MSIQTSNDRFPDVEEAARNLMRACKRHNFRRVSVTADDTIIIRISYMRPGSEDEYYIKPERLREAEKGVN